MKKDETLTAIKSSRVVIILRLSDARKTVQAAKAVSKGGIHCIEIPMTVPDALKVIQALSANSSFDIVVGAGTVLDADSAQAAIEAGAQYIVSPHTDFGVIEVCRRYQKVAIPGAFTPTEIFRAWKAGADIVKVFPIRAVGPTYISDIKGPFPDVELIPSGGVSIDNAADFLMAGACAVTVGRDVAETKAIDRGDFNAITDNARRLIANIASVNN
jgi:2-dehydro-3-deoxyphosphogluconate aldolase / (4S)-4-hydroxy-2-oxoglutarate aldolase